MAATSGVSGVWRGPEVAAQRLDCDEITGHAPNAGAGTDAGWLRYRVIEGRAMSRTARWLQRLRRPLLECGCEGLRVSQLRQGQSGTFPWTIRLPAMPRRSPRGRAMTMRYEITLKDGT